MPVAYISRCWASGSRLPRRLCLLPRTSRPLKPTTTSARASCHPAQPAAPKSKRPHPGGCTKAPDECLVRFEAAGLSPERGSPAWGSPGRLRSPLKNEAPHCHVSASRSVLRKRRRRAPTWVWDSRQFDCLISRPEADWIGLAFIGYSREKMPTCSGEIGTGWRSTIQRTPSEHGGVVSEPM